MRKLQRQEAILLSLKKFDYLTRWQIQQIHNLKSDRNAQRIMKEMEEYVHVLKEGENIYYLNAKGRETVGSEKVRKKTTTVEHYIMRNYLYIALGFPAEWKNEIEIVSIKQKDKLRCRPDALIHKGGYYTIIEVDNMQKMNENLNKIDRYRQLILRGAFGLVTPKFVWITRTEYRKKELLKACEGLKVDVYLLSDFKHRGNES